VTELAAQNGLTTREVLQLSFLGAMEIRVGIDPIAANAWQRIDAKRLLCALVLNPHHCASRDELCQQLFPGVDKFSARSKLSNTLYSLRKALGTASERIVASAHVVELVWGSSVRWDVERFEQCLDAAACCTDVGEKADELEQALSLYRGELLQDIPVEPWFAQDRTLLHTRLLWALDQLVALYSGQERLAKAIDCQRQRVDIAGAAQDQAGHAKLIAMLVEAGRLTEAAVQYKQCRALLASELGEAPSAALQALYQQIKAYDAAQAAPAAPASPTPLLAAAPALMPPAPSSPAINPPVLVAAPLGRDQDAAAVLALLLAPEPVDEPNRRGRLVTLTGFGGVGKTTLARHLMQRWRAAVRALEGSVAEGREPYTVFIDASEMATVEVLAERLVHALGVPLSLLAPLTEPVPVNEELHRLEGLIVVDNYEHLVDQAPILAALGAHCPGLTVLVTSRIPLRLKHEQSYALAPLKIATDAVTLFVSRARARNPKLRFDSETLAVVTSICSRLDGLPLAIELAAARSRLFSPHELLARLTTDLKLLHALPTANTVDGEAHWTSAGNQTRASHGSLWGILAWTVNLLSLRERALLMWLNVFQGGFTLSAVEAVFAVCQGEGEGEDRPAHIETTDLFERLIDHQLIVPMERLPWVDLSELEQAQEGEESTNTYKGGSAKDHTQPSAAEEQRWMLLETVKQFVSSELNTKIDPDKVADAAHAKYFIDTMTTLIDENPHSDATSLFFTHESRNLLAAFEVRFAINPQNTLDPLLRALLHWANRGTSADAVHGWVHRLNYTIHNSILVCSPTQREQLDVVLMLQCHMDGQPQKGIESACKLLERFKNGDPLSSGMLEACALVCFHPQLIDPGEAERLSDAMFSQLQQQPRSWAVHTNFFSYKLYSLWCAGRWADIATVECFLGSAASLGRADLMSLTVRSYKSNKSGELDNARLICYDLLAKEQLQISLTDCLFFLVPQAILALDNDQLDWALSLCTTFDRLNGLSMRLANERNRLIAVLRNYVAARSGSSLANNAMREDLEIWSNRVLYPPYLSYWYLAAKVLVRDADGLAIFFERLLVARPTLPFFHTIRWLETLGCACVILKEPRLATECFLMSHEGHDRNEFVLSVVQRSERVALGVPLRIETDSTVYRDMPIETFSGHKFWEHIEPTVKALHEKGQQLAANQEAPTPPSITAQP
jgi:predicted ATPase/DNA-binding SARP family transcriptional activator